MRDGASLDEPTFRDAADKFIEEYAVLTAGERNAGYARSHAVRIKNHLSPFFGKMPLSQITAGAMQDYRQMRTKPKKDKKPPSRSTLHHEEVTLRQVMKTALRHGWIPYLPDFSAPYKASGKVTHRGWFSHEEYKLLYTATRENAKALEGTQEEILEIHVHGKRGVGFCKSTTGAVFPFKRLLERNKPKPTDRIFPHNHTKQFNRILNLLDLKFDREGNRRSLYSLHHSHISFRLLEGADIYMIAKNCRTSVKMIEQHYATHIKNSIDARVIMFTHKALIFDTKANLNSKNLTPASGLFLIKIQRSPQ